MPESIIHVDKVRSGPTMGSPGGTFIQIMKIDTENSSNPQVILLLLDEAETVRHKLENLLGGQNGM